MLTIGEFSRITKVSARMLRHYDMMGLLRPAHTGEENGYRYYDLTQLATLRQIETLKDYGFALSEIRELMALPGEELARRIHAKRVLAHKELAQMRKKIRQMEDAIIQMEGNSMALEKYHVIVMQCPEQKVFSMRKTIHISELHQLFEDVHAEMKKRGIARAGATQLIYMGDEFNYEAQDVEAQVQVAQDGEGVKTIPAMTCVATTHVGPYENTKDAYEAIAAWMAQHPEYQMAGPGMERFIKDENMTQDPEEYETGVLIPVVKVQG